MLEPCNETDLQRAAVGYARLAMRVFPASRSKAPLQPRPLPDEEPLAPLAPWQDRTKGGLHAAYDDPEVVRALWRVYPDANVGYAIPPGTVVVDVDSERALA